MERAMVLLSQVISFGTAWCMFRCILKGKDKNRHLSGWKEAILPAAALLYLLLPAHVNVVKDNRDWSQIMIWMLVPVLVSALIQMADTDKKLWKCGFGLAGVLVLGIIGRLDGVAGLTILFLICVAGISKRNREYPVVGIVGTVLAYPTYITWKHWIFDGNFADSGLEYASIMERGYSIGGLFSTYFHRDGNPGMGILLMACLLFLVYVSFVKGRKVFERKDYLWFCAAGLLTLMSLRYFPWDFVQRMGTWALGLVTLIGTPAVFFPYVQMILCVISVEKIGNIVMAEKMENKTENELKKAM